MADEAITHMERGSIRRGIFFIMLGVIFLIDRHKRSDCSLGLWNGELIIDSAVDEKNARDHYVADR
jgi:hypothetical protein